MSGRRPDEYPLYLATRKNSHEHARSGRRGPLQVGEEPIEPWTITRKGPHYDRGINHRLHKRDHDMVHHDCYTFTQRSIEDGSAVSTNEEGMRIVKQVRLLNPLLRIFTNNKWVSEDGTLLTTNKLRVLEEGLRMASGFVCHWKNAPFWCALVCDRDGLGQVKMEEIEKVEKIAKTIDDSRRGSATDAAMQEPFTCSLKDHEKLQRQVDVEFPEITFSFGLVGAPGSNMAPCEYLQVRRDWSEVKESYMYTVRLHSDILTFVGFLASNGMPGDLSGKSDSWRCMLIRFNFMVASLLTAAIAIVVDFDNGYRKVMHEYNPPDIWLNKSCHNVGIAAMQILFGGIIAPISWRCDTMHGLARTSWCGDRDNPGPAEESYAISVDYIAELQFPGTFTRQAGETNQHVDYFYHSPLFAASAAQRVRHNTSNRTFGERQLHESLSI